MYIKMKLFLLTLGSIMITTTVITSAFYQKKQFYPSVIYMTKSSVSMAALYLQAFVFVIIISKLLGKIFFGQLRPAEVEHLIERMWYAITETCLAFTVFRDDFSSKFVAMFTILLFFKCFHWLAEDRVDFMERSPVIPVKFHIRIIGLIAMLSTVDYMFILYAYQVTVDRGPSSQLVFGFEYTILKLSLFVILFRYVLHTIDSRRETPWDQKATFMLYIDLVSNFLKLALYLLFLCLMIKVHTLPLFIIRPVYLSLRSFKKSVQDLILSRRAIHYMNTVFPNASEADLNAGDNICIICREEMVANATAGRDQQGSVPKCLPCAHIFHGSCLKTWFQRQQTCPTCRMDILRNAQNPSRPTPSSADQAPNQNGTPNVANNVPSVVTSGNNTTATSTTTNSAANSQLPQMPLNFPPFPQTMFPWLLSPPPPLVPNVDSNSAPNLPPVPPPPFAPFMLPGMPIFSRPMPELSSEDMAKMSEEDLIRLEKQGREGIEFRIQTIQRIQTLLDAAVLQMNAYMISVRNMTTNDQTPNSTATNVVASETGAESVKGDEAKENVVIPRFTDGEEKVTVLEEKIIEDDQSEQKFDEIDNELSKLRDRRLKKFGSLTIENSELNGSTTPESSTATASSTSTTTLPRSGTGADQ